MTTPQAVVYGVVQGLTEFLPVSSSAHLALLPWLTGWRDPGLSFDVAMHLGTLAALLVYFWRDWLQMIRAALLEPRSERARPLWLIAAASVPAVVAGLLVEPFVEGILRDPRVMALTLPAFGWLMVWAERRSRRRDGLQELSLARALRVGCAQALALIPGVSRSGITITAGLLEGMTPEAAARLSFLMATPITLGAALHQVPELRGSDAGLAAAVGVLSAAATGLLVIRFLLRWVRTRSLAPFAWYRTALAALILGRSLL